MSARSSKPRQPPMDGSLTMRQSVAARLDGRVEGLAVNWKFGHASFETDEGKVFCFITREGNLAMKLPPARIETLLEDGQASPLRMGKRTMREWVVVPEPESTTALKLLHEAKTYVESLPKNARQRKPPRKSLR